MRKLNKINIMGRKVKIVYKKTDDLHGSFDGDKHIIELDKSVLLDPELYEATLIHECIHAVLFYSGLNELLTDEKEEAIVRSLEYNLLPVVKNLLK